MCKSNGLKNHGHGVANRIPHKKTFFEILDKLSNKYRVLFTLSAYKYMIVRNYNHEQNTISRKSK